MPGRRKADAAPARGRGKARRAPASARAAAPARWGSGGVLVIVESPAKANTIKKYLGPGYLVKASVGHVKDLPKNIMGIDIEHSFQPKYEVIEGKRKVLAEIKLAASRAANVLLAPDPDREGEAIAWHIAEEIRPANPNLARVSFNEITKQAVAEAIAHPQPLDRNKFESQQARRILDRLVGYEISPMLWTKVKRGLSAGRVQSVAVRLVAEREAEIRAFRSEEYWTVDADLEGSVPPPFAVRLVRIDGEKPQLPTGAKAQEAAELVRAASLRVASVERKERRKYPPPPFITSKLQQEAANRLRFSPKRTMALAQRLYEGVELGEEGPTGLITYMRTDSIRLSDDALRAARGTIAERFGAAFLPAGPVVYKNKKGAQDAHEAIRPADVRRDPEAVRRLMRGGRDPRENQDLVKLYTLIWNRFVACQMAPATFDQTVIEVEGARVGLRATGQVVKFPGFLEVYAESGDEAAADEDGTRQLPALEPGQGVRLIEVKPEQHFTQPPPRYSEASLVKDLEEKGIGRPSTYAAILSTIQERGYVERREGRLHPTELGSVVNDLLVTSFPDIVNVDFTAQMEERLDQVEEGEANWVALLQSFYGPFKANLARARVEMRDLKREEQRTDEVCDKCGSPMVIKWGRNGHFLACSAYPDCRNTKEYARKQDGTIEILPTTRPSDQGCPSCASPMVVRRGRFGEFLACTRYPECKTTSPLSLGVACQRPGCGGYLAEKRSRRGKVFYGCSQYGKTRCDFISWDKPVPHACPSCGAAFLVEKVSKAGRRLRCIAPGCRYLASTEEAGDRPVEATVGNR